MSEDLLIRPCQPADLPAIRDITDRAFVQVSVDAMIERQYGLLEGTGWRERKWSTVEAEIQTNPAGCFSALLGGQVVGYTTTGIDQQAGIGRIINLAVDPDFHSRGLGKRLIGRAFDHFRELQLPHYRIETTANNEVGQALYPRCGFREVTRQIIYFMSADEAEEWTFNTGRTQETS